MTVDPSLTTTVLLTAAIVLAQRPDLAIRRRCDRREGVVLYPVRDGDEATMRRDLSAGRDRAGRVVAVADHDDREAIATLERLRQELPFLDVVVPPPADDPSWSEVWASWLAQKQKRWREPMSGPVLPPRQRRQVVYGYHHVEAGGGGVVDGVLA